MKSRSARPLRRFWGWGLESDELLPMEIAIIQGLMARLGIARRTLPTPPAGVGLRVAAPRITPPPSSMTASPMPRTIA